MDNHNRAGAQGNSRFNLIRIENERRRFNVRKYRASAKRTDGAARGNERKRGNNHFVTGLHATSVQPELKRLCSGGESNGEAYPTGRGDFLLQRFPLRPEHKLLRGQHGLDGGANLGRDRVELRSQVEHRNHFQGRAWWRGHRGFERSWQGVGNFTAQLWYHAPRAPGSLGGAS